MTTKPQPEPHLDADQLTAFAEGALSASERALCLQHLSECAHCREIAFLAGASLPQEPTPAPVRGHGFTWWPVLSLGAAALGALIITVMLLHRPHHVATAPVQIARESQAAAPPPPVAEEPAAQPAIARPQKHSAPKPSPALKPSPKPETPTPDNRLKDAVTLDSMAAPAAPAAGAVAQSATGNKSMHGTAGAIGGPLIQQSQAKAAASPNATAGLAMRAYNAATSNGLAQISGTITDNSGATIAHAKVTLDQASGTDHRETLADAAGRFNISSLPPGKYRLQFSSPGFTTQTREVDLGTSQLAQVDSKLAAGAASETVTVEAAGAALKTETANLTSQLPGKESPQASVSSGTRTLALDDTGKLFLSKKAGKHWKAVHGPWKKSEVTNLSLAPDQNFKVTTAQGSWLSSDGEHWHPAN